MGILCEHEYLSLGQVLSSFPLWQVLSQPTSQKQRFL